MKVNCAEDCGDAPKKALLKDMCINFWRDDGQLVVDNLSDGAVWHIVGSSRHEGKENIGKRLVKDRMGKPAELHIHNIITHGNTAAANATVLMQDGTRLEYCDVYQFAGFGKKAKIKEITTYRVHLIHQ